MSARNGKAVSDGSDRVYDSLMTQWRALGNEQSTLPWTSRLAAVLGGAGSLEANPNRDLDLECGYEKFPTPQTFKAAYDRIGVANRYVNIWPDECWAAHPELYEDEDPANVTPFEAAWKALERRCLPWHYLHRADRLSRIGRYGIILLGLGDGLPMSKPVAGLRRDGTRRRNATDVPLKYLRAFDETNLRIVEVDDDQNSPRFNQPTVYEITYTGNAATTDGPLRRGSLRVHWTRAIHVADNRECSEVYGVPALNAVLNDVYDIRKVSGSSAEMFYKGGFPGYSFTAFPDMSTAAPLNKAAVREEVLAYQNGLQRFLSAVGGEWKSLAPQVADPSKNLDQKIAMLCATGGVPVPVFLGMQQGHLAGTENTASWKERVGSRQKNYLEPMEVRPLADRLIAVGSLPAPKADYFLAWRDLKSIGEEAQAEVGLKRVQALMQYVTGKAFLAVPPRMLLTTVLNYSDQEATTIIKQLGGEDAMMAALKKSAEPVPKAVGFGGGPSPAQGGKQIGNPPAKTIGRPKGRVEKTTKGR